MLRMMFIAALLLAQAGPISDARQIALAEPQVVAELDSGKMKGEPWRLAWSADDKDLYLQTVERDGRGTVKSARHFVVSIGDRAMKGLDQEPAWAAKYWTWKSGQTSPASPAFKIAVESRQESLRATAAPTGGDLAKGGTAPATAGSSMGDVASAAYGSQTQNVFSLRLNGELIGEWVNEPVAPGINFGWAPAPRRLLAYARRDGGPLTLIDDQGHKSEPGATKAAVLPAWSNDGTKIAWLEKKDKKHYALTIANVASR